MFLFSKARRDDPRPEPLPLSSQEARVANIVNTAQDDMADAAMSSTVRNAIITRDFGAIVDAFPFEDMETTLGGVTEVFEETLRGGIGNGLPAKILIGKTFDYTDPRAIEWAKNQSALLVTNMTKDMQMRVREVIARSFTENITVQQTARNLRDVINLTARQEVSYAKFLLNLDEQVAAGTITRAQQLKMLERQYKKMTNYRAEVIARQEIIMAENNGRYLGFTQAVEQGWADPKSVKRWSTSTDERTCEICMPMNGKSVQWDKPYPNGVFNPPAHIMCRCTISLLEPNSRLAQDFMTEAPVAPVSINTPIPELPKVPIGTSKTIEQAVEEAHTKASGLSVFQYDAGEIEGLNVAVESIIFNGLPATELRFKLTSKAKDRLSQSIERGVAQDQSTWAKSNNYALVDKKTNKAMDFVYVSDDQYERLNVPAAYRKADPTSSTYTRVMPDGASIRFIKSQNAYSFDGLVRVAIPGKATPQQIEKVMKELGVTANRLPTPEDIDILKKNQLLNLFFPNYGTVLQKSPVVIQEDLQKALTFFKMTLDDIVTEIDNEGNLRLLMPERVAEQIMDATGVKSIKHSLGGFLYDLSTEERVEKVVALFLQQPKLLSNTQRKYRGVKGQGMSESEDILTGGADYVFMRPSENPITDVAMFTGEMIFSPKSLLRRMDWFAYSGDSYGVKNPKMFGGYLHTKGGKKKLEEVNYLEEMTKPTSRAEIMFRDSVDIADLEKFYVDPQTRDGVISALRGLGITEWNGRKIEDILALPKEYL